MDTEQTQQWETGSHNTEWGYVDTAAHTTHNTEHTQVRRSSRKHTDWRIAHSWRRRGVLPWQGVGRGGPTPQPWSVLSLQGRRTPPHLIFFSFPHRRIPHRSRHDETSFKDADYRVCREFSKFSRAHLSRNRGCGKHERKLETAKIGGPSTADTTFRWLPFTLLHEKLPLELKRRSLLSF